MFQNLAISIFLHVLIIFDHVVQYCSWLHQVYPCCSIFCYFMLMLVEFVSNFHFGSHLFNLNQFGSIWINLDQFAIFVFNQGTTGRPPEVWGVSPEVLDPSPEVSPEILSKMCQKLHFGCGCDQTERKEQKVIKHSLVYVRFLTEPGAVFLRI